MTEFEKDDGVRWSYNHYLNSTACTRITKRGKFIRHVKLRFGGVPESVVHFTGNKGTSRVPTEDLINDDS